MTEDKARKRSIRARMAKTGESYTAARRHVVGSDAQESAPLPPVDLGQSDAAILRGSGRRWEEWFALLDAWGARGRSHGEIARHVHEHGVPGWWAQAVAVGYERGRGMRRVHERPGGFSVSVSKTVPIGVEALSEHFTDARKRSRWLEAGALRTRTSVPGRSARFDFRDGVGRVHAYFVSKGPSKSAVQVQHERLADEDAVEEMRAFWKERLAALADLVSR
jgi:hypothetical protein